ncbi:hypothetical protein LCGC14_1345930 [marine sediment metagenome]|uniref:Uncharacterized protein n=1 Tax=marine sediment metagenome TaxID=412755 RepID=A0A0F9NEP9_9ZZZZ
MQRKILELLRQIWKITPEESLLTIIGSCFADDIELYYVSDEDLKDNLEALLLIEQRRMERRNNASTHKN